MQKLRQAKTSSSYLQILSCLLMKTKSDPRHLKRREIIQSLFTWDFDKSQKSQLIKPILRKLKTIDKLIDDAASERPLNQINKVDLAILRSAVFELIIKKDLPYKVVIDEAVELGKEFGGDTSASFINGVLGKIYEQFGKKDSTNHS